MNDGYKEQGSEFDLLTEKQAAVLALLANNRTTKEIAHTLGASESSVNRRIELLRSRLGGVTRHELARRYRDWMLAEEAREGATNAGVEKAKQNLQLAPAAESVEKPDQDDGAPVPGFEDSLKISIEAPWNRPATPRIVPGVLDGENAVLTRGAAIAMILFGILASLVLALAAVKALTDAIG